MRISLQSKIWITVCTIVLLFSFFILFYFPAQQERYLIKNYNKEVSNLAGTVALGVKIALIEQNFESVQTAMDFVKDDPHLKFVAMVQYDTVWNDSRINFVIRKKIFRIYPDSVKVNLGNYNNDSLIVKSAEFVTPILSGEILLGFTTTEIVQSKRHVRAISMIVSAVVFIIGILIGFWLARRISVPVLALRDAAEKVGEGDRSQFIKASAKDEIGDLTRAFNKMVADLKTAEDKVKSTQAQLVASEKMASLGQLTAGIAHEIKNPLNFINNFSELNTELIQQINDAVDEKEKHELLEDLKVNMEKINLYGKRADNVITAMLMHSRTLKEDLRPADINSLCDEAMNLTYLTARAREPGFYCTFERNLDPDLPKVKANAQDLSRVFLNIMSNAIYAVSVAGKKDYNPLIVVTTYAQNNVVHVIIKDNGNGIAPAAVSKVFEPFYTTKPTGQATGLGLSISYEIIKAHGGDISVRSDEGVYTEFSVSIPVGYS
ncbi:MAG: HAMP domain-containing histidine kinase [Bacteroidia bacterium]|nr:HAMP domain-containing histidine kinase [Bacteroidia bacterium]